MGFFAEFNAWLEALLRTFIADKTALIAQLLEPVIVTMGVLYVVLWGYLQIMGRVEEPFMVGVRRLLTLALILGVSLHLWAYNEVIVGFFFEAPQGLAAQMIGGTEMPETVGIIDEIFFDGDDAASLLLTKGEIFNRNIIYYAAAGAVYLFVGATAVYTMFLLALSRIALCVLIALGPAFIALLFFETTKRFFEAWLAQLSNYAFLTILAVLVAALMLHVIATAAQQAVAAGPDIQIAHALRLCVAAALTLLIMWQAPSMAQGLASGVALSSLGSVGAVGRMGWRIGVGTRRRVAEFSRGMTLDTYRGRDDSFSRMTGQKLPWSKMERAKRPRANSVRFTR
jgi:type IV secretion system protein VirB6